MLDLILIFIIWIASDNNFKTELVVKPHSQHEPVKKPVLFFYCLSIKKTDRKLFLDIQVTTISCKLFRIY
jgi:hypothetical protein